MTKLSFFQGLARNIIIVGFVSLFTDLSSQMVFPIVPLFLLSLGASAWVVDLAPPDLKGTALGTFHTATGLIALPAGIIAGVLWDTFSPEATFLFALALSICSLLLFAFVKNTKQGSIVS